MHTRYSVVVPLKNEEENISELVHEIKEVMHTLDDPNWELICIDDGSTDGTLQILKTLSVRFPFLKILSFDRNYGQSAAFDAGFKHAQGEWVITLDGDRQNDPADIPKLLAVAEHYDLVCGSRVKRKDPWHKKCVSLLANFVRSRFCNDQISDTGCSLKVYRSSCLKKIKMFKGMHRFLPALFKMEGFRVTEIPVNHRERVKGATKYNFFNRSFNTIADMMAVRWMWKRHIDYRMAEASPQHNVFLFCGEPSGDLHGSSLVKALKERDPSLHLSGVAGPKMRMEGVLPFIKMENFEVMGLTDVLASLPGLVRSFYKIRSQIIKSKPDAVLLIDYPGFNLRLAKSLRESGYQGKLVQYISPSVWAWGKERIDSMDKTLDMLLTIYPFESRYFANGKAIYVGNPLVEYVNKHHYDETWKQKLEIPESGPLIALFPGSRLGEIKRNLPVMLDAAALYKQKYPDTLFALSSTHAAVSEIGGVMKLPPSLKESIFMVPPTYTYELMRDSRTAIAKSGSVTLELALHRRPTVVIYKLSLINRLYAQYFLKLALPHYCIVNILAGKEVYPELIEEKLNAQKLLQQLEKIDTQQSVRETCINACSQLIKEMGDAQASQAAADSILQILK